MTSLSIAQPGLKPARANRPSAGMRQKADRREREAMREEEALKSVTVMILVAALLGASDPWGPDLA